MKKFKNLIHWQHQINNTNANADNGFVNRTVSNLRVKNELCNGSEEKTRIDKFHNPHTKISIDVLVNTRPSRQCKFIHPIVTHKSKNN